MDEIDVALHVNEDTSSYNNLELEGRSRLKDILPTRYGLIISIIQSKVYFIHQTVKEFLLNTTGVEPPRRTWQKSLYLEESHDIMTEICLRSITFSEIRLDRANLCNALLPENDRDMEPNGYCQSYVFLLYATIYWADYYRNTLNSKYLGIIARFLEISDRRPVIGEYSRNFGTTLDAALFGGYEKIVQLLLDKGAEVNAQGGHYGNALQAALAGGHEQVVKILLDEGAEVNAQGGDYGNALHAASAEGYEQVVKILLDEGADVNAQGRRYGNALQAALARGHEQVVKILLDEGADVNAQGGHYGNALHAASAKGYEQVVKILLDEGADVNAQGGDYGNALQAASAGGDEQVVKILLDNGAEVNA